MNSNEAVLISTQCNTEAKESSMVRGVGFAYEFTGTVYPIGDESLHRSITCESFKSPRAHSTWGC
jgi:hypothetical protein